MEWPAHPPLVGGGGVSQVAVLDIYWTILHCLGQDMQVLDKFCIWVELPIQRRLYPIFLKNVGSPDIHEYSAG